MSQTEPGVRTARRHLEPAIWAGTILLVCGGVAAWVLAGSDSRVAGRFPPRESLFTVGNGLQALSLVGAGAVLALARRPVAQSVAAGVAVSSAGLLFGSSVVGVKHAQPYSGISAVARYEALEQQAMVVSAVAAAAGVAALLWLMASRSFTLEIRRGIQAACVAAGLVVLVAVPPLAGLGGSGGLDVTSQGAYALLWGLPWVICLALAGFVRPHVAMGLLVVTAVSQVCTIVFWPMPDLVGWTDAVGGVVGLVATAIVWRALSRSWPARVMRYDGK